MNKSKLHSALARLPAYQALGPRARSVLQFLWSLAGRGEEAGEGAYILECRARIETIADAESCSRATVKRALAELEDARLIARARTGRASSYSLFVDAPVGQAPTPMAQPCAIRGLTREPSDGSSVSHRAAPSICLDQDHLTKTTSTARGPAAAGGSRSGEPKATTAEAAPELDGAAAVAFELLTGPECPRALRFATPADRSQVRRLVSGLAEREWPVVEIVRYAIDAGGQPGLRNGRAMVVATLKEPDLHAVYEHASRLRALGESRRRSEARARAEAEHGREQAGRERAAAESIERVLAAATPEELLGAAQRAAEHAAPFVARQLRQASPEDLRRRPSLRGLVAAALLEHPERDTAVA